MTRTRTRGFTLVELMVTVVVLVVLVSMAIPSFDYVKLSNRLNSYSTDLVAGSQVARSEAIKRNAQVTLCVSTNGTSCATTGLWETGWIVISADGVVIQKQPATASGYQIRDSGGLSALAFEATGVGATAANFTICRSSPLGSQERVVKVSATGRSSITRTSAGVCAAA